MWALHCRGCMKPIRKKGTGKAHCLPNYKAMITNILLKSLRGTITFGLLFFLLQFIWDGFSMETLNSVLEDAPRHLFMLLFIFIVAILQNIIRQQRKVKLQSDLKKNVSC